MAETTSITIRLPNDVLAALDHQGGKRTEALIAALRTWMAGGQTAGPDPRVAELQAEVARLRALSVKSTIDAVATKRVQRSEHQSGPIYEPRLTVSGHTTSMFKKSMKVTV